MITYIMIGVFAVICMQISSYLCERWVASVEGASLEKTALLEGFKKAKSLPENPLSGVLAYTVKALLWPIEIPFHLFGIWGVYNVVKEEKKNSPIMKHSKDMKTLLKGVEDAALIQELADSVPEEELGEIGEELGALDRKIRESSGAESRIPDGGFLNEELRGKMRELINKKKKAS